MKKEIRNQYLKLFGGSAILLLAGILFYQLFNDSGSSAKLKEKKEKENITGGPCSYQKLKFPVIILKIEKSGESESNILFVQCDSTRTDHFCDTLLSYRSLNQSYVQTAEIEKLHLKVGDTLTLIEERIIKGSCSPMMSYYKLERYSND